MQVQPDTTEHQTDPWCCSDWEDYHCDRLGRGPSCVAFDVAYPSFSEHIERSRFFWSIKENGEYKSGSQGSNLVAHRTEGTKTDILC